MAGMNSQRSSEGARPALIGDVWVRSSAPRELRAAREGGGTAVLAGVRAESGMLVATRGDTLERVLRSSEPYGRTGLANAAVPAVLGRGDRF